MIYSLNNYNLYPAPKMLIRSRKYILQRNCGSEILELVSHDIHNIHEDVFMQTCSSPSKKLFKYSFFFFTCLSSFI